MRRLLSSLRGRIFMASALVAVLSLGVVLQVVTRRIGEEAEADIRRGLERAARLVEEQHAARLSSLAVQARLIADLPTLKAAVATGDAPTVAPVAADLRQRSRADVLGVTDARGSALAWIGAGGGGLDPAAVGRALAGAEAATFLAAPGAVLQVISVPIQVGPEPPELLGSLSLGAALDDRLARQYQAVTDSEVAFAIGGSVRASSLPKAREAALVALLAAPSRAPRELEGGEYLGVRWPLTPEPDGPVALILRSRAERLALLRSSRAAILGAGLLALALALALSYGVARSVSQPLAELTQVMREMTATGDLARRMGPPRAWRDEDAAVVAASFNALTEAIARFQAEAALRERLSALGRLSAVIAHEVRNPLMIIKSSLASLRRDGLSEAAAREAAAEIEHEVARLNTLVNGVLDFARPVRLEYAPVELAGLAKDAAAAALSGEPRVDFVIEAGGAPETILSDAERLRTVLVNLLGNAREAVLLRRQADSSPRPDGPEVRIRLWAAGGRLSIAVEDRGAGIPPERLASVFEPFFSTRRNGTGLGLAITRNIVEALGGSILLEARAGGGTTARVELPERPERAS